MTTSTALLVGLALFGLIIGSFLNVCIHRVPMRLSVVRPGSRCPACGHMLGWADNIPVVSYALLGGRCRACRSPISFRYPLVELLTMAIFVVHGLILGVDLLLVPRLLFASALIVLFAIDFEHHLLPNAITLPGIACGFLFSLAFTPGPLSSLIGMVAGGGVLWLVGEAYYRYAGREGMGGGDVKMLAMIGAFLGWPLMIVTLMLSSITGAVFGLAVIASRRGGMRHELPYGTFLALAALGASWFGERLIAWYTAFY